MPSLDSEIVVPVQGNINLEELIKFRLSEKLSFAPELFCFSYKRKGEQAIVSYKTDSEESRIEIVKREQRKWQLSLVWGLVLMFALLILNFLILFISKNNQLQAIGNNQFIKNNQYHNKKDLKRLKTIRMNNKNRFRLIESFLSQPININTIRITTKNIYVDGFVAQEYIQKFGDFLLKENLLKSTSFKEEGANIWVLIKS